MYAYFIDGAKAQLKYFNQIFICVQLLEDTNIPALPLFLNYGYDHLKYKRKRRILVNSANK